MSTVVIVNAFDPDDFFISRLSNAYEATLHQRNLSTEVLYINQMNFSYTPFPEQYTFTSLENDLKKSVRAIREASTVAIFTSTKPGKQAPAFTQVVYWLFHLKPGGINLDILGQISVYNKVLRIITVMDDS